MEPIMAMKNVFKQVAQEMVKSDQTLSLKENEIVIGKVTKLFLDQKAMIQIGQTRMVAQLETALNSLQHYWFVVKGTDETGGLQLKVLKEAAGEQLTAVQQAKDLLSLMQIRPNKENMTLLTELIKQNTSFTKAELSSALSLLKMIPKSDQEKAIQAILFSLNRNLPMTESVIKSLIATQSSKNLSEDLQSLHTNLNVERDHGNVIESLRNKLTELLQKPMENYKDKIVSLLMKEQTDPKLLKQDRQVIESLINKLVQPRQNQAAILNALVAQIEKAETGQNQLRSTGEQLSQSINKPNEQGPSVAQLRQEQIVKVETGQNQLRPTGEQLSQSTNKVNDQVSSVIQPRQEQAVKGEGGQNQSRSTGEQLSQTTNKNEQGPSVIQPRQEQMVKVEAGQNQLRPAGEQLSQSTSKPNEQAVQESQVQTDSKNVKQERQLIDLILNKLNQPKQIDSMNTTVSREQLMNDKLLQASTNPINNSEPFTTREINLIHRVISQVPMLETKQDVLQLFTSLEEKLGQKNEISLLHQLSKDGFMKTEENVDGLKQLLIAAQKNVQSPIVREQIDQLILRLNGNTLLHQDHGPTQQIITQIPLNFGTYQTDLTIQWNGSKRDDGTIDPNYCRVLFYLELFHLEEIMIDVHIQNRVLTISILNNNEYLERFVHMQSNDLKESLREMNYQLSSIKVRPFEQEKQEEKRQLTRPQVYPKGSGYTGGVDISI